MPNTVSIKWDLAELHESIRRMPEELHSEAFDIMEATIGAAKADIEAAYPEKTGNLKRGLIIEHQAGLLRTLMVLKNKAKHAWIYEHGTQARHFTGTDKRGRKYVIGDRGAMPPGNVFIPRMIRYRRLFYDRMADLLERHGLLVTGRAA